jgi:hypothetical protein
MCISSTSDCSSSSCNQATRELNLLDSTRLVSDLNQHHPVLHGNHHRRVFRFICIPVEI